MKIPARILPLIEDGIVDDVFMTLRAGKEAEVYLVHSGEDVLCAKVYKELQNRSFHNQALYLEGRHVRSSRRERAMSKHTSYGKKVEEETWHTAEADTLFVLHRAGVRVPTPQICLGGVLIMELVLDAEGNVAPRLGDMVYTPEEARYYHELIIVQIVAMLCAGVVHADLSEYNVLMAWDGPVIIDFPQAVDASANNNAQMFLERDVGNITAFFGKYDPDLLVTNFGKEIWQHYAKGELTKNTVLTGVYIPPAGATDVAAVLSEISDARDEAIEKSERHKRIRESAPEAPVPAGGFKRRKRHR